MFKSHQLIRFNDIDQGKDWQSSVDSKEMGENTLEASACGVYLSQDQLFKSERRNRL